MTARARPVALVCGATGTLGSEIARRLSADGFTVALHTTRNTARATQLQDELATASVVCVADLREESAIVAMHAQIAEELGPPRVLVNTAYPAADDGDVHTLTAASIRAHTDALIMTALSCKHAVEGMRTLGDGRIVNLSGALATRVFPGTAMFSAVSAGLIAFSRSLALETGRDGTTVNVVAPGKVSMPGGTDGDLYGELEELSRRRAALPHFASPIDVADAVSYLCSPGARSVSGQTLFLAAGEPV